MYMNTVYFHFIRQRNDQTWYTVCLLYTSDAADEEDSVDLGGRRIIKKKTKITPSVVRILDNKHRQKNIDGLTIKDKQTC